MWINEDNNQTNRDFDKIEKEVFKEKPKENKKINKSKEFKKISSELEKQEKELINQLNMIKNSDNINH